MPDIVYGPAGATCKQEELVESFDRLFASAEEPDS